MAHYENFRRVGEQYLNYAHHQSPFSSQDDKPNRTSYSASRIAHEAHREERWWQELLHSARDDLQRATGWAWHLERLHLEMAPNWWPMRFDPQIEHLGVRPPLTWVRIPDEMVCTQQLRMNFPYNQLLALVIKSAEKMHDSDTHFGEHVRYVDKRAEELALAKMAKEVEEIRLRAKAEELERQRREREAEEEALEILHRAGLKHDVTMHIFAGGFGVRAEGCSACQAAADIP